MGARAAPGRACCFPAGACGGIAFCCCDPGSEGSVEAFLALATHSSTARPCPCRLGAPCRWLGLRLLRAAGPPTAGLRLLQGGGLLQPRVPSQGEAPLAGLCPALRAYSGSKQRGNDH